MGGSFNLQLVLKLLPYLGIKMGITIHYRAVIRCSGSYIDELFDRLEIFLGQTPF